MSQWPVIHYVALGGRGCLSVSRVRFLGLKYLSQTQCENNRQRHESVSEHTQSGQITPSQMGMVKWTGDRDYGRVAMCMPLVSGKGYKSIIPCALCKFPKVQELKGWWWLEIQFDLPSINATAIGRIMPIAHPCKQIEFVSLGIHAVFSRFVN